MNTLSKMRGQKVTRRNPSTGVFKCFLLLMKPLSFTTVHFWGPTEECENVAGDRVDHEFKSEALERLRKWRVTCENKGFREEAIVTLTYNTAVRPRLEDG
jgi:hypothetical protein